jgi:hypothetical protein
MTTLTMRVVRGDFIVTGPDIEPMKFKSRREAKDRCMTHHPGSPITGFGPRGKRKPASDTSSVAIEGNQTCRAHAKIDANDPIRTSGHRF